MQAKAVRRGWGFLVVLTGALLTLGLSFPFTQPCCPRAAVFESQDPWVCPANCPGGGVTRLMYEVEFLADGKACDPGEEFSIFAYNVTDDGLLPPLVLDNPQTGVYEGEVEVVLQYDTTFRLEAKRDSATCGELSEELAVLVVDPGDSEVISISDATLDPPNCTTAKHSFFFGPGVMIDYIENLTDYNISVEKAGIKDAILPRANGYGLRNEEASGDYAIGLTDVSECADYADLDEAAKVLKIRVFLQCGCSPAP